jgi:hypothetical protein
LAQALSVASPPARSGLEQQTGLVFPLRLFTLLGDDGNWSLVLYCTGVRGRSSVDGVKVQIGDLNLTPFYAGSPLQFAGLDQINVRLPRTIAGSGAVGVQVDVDGFLSNIGSQSFR